MADPIAAMLGLELEDEEQARRLADQLRSQRRAAEAFTMSGTPQIAQGSVKELASIDAAAKQAGSLRQRGLDRAMQQRLQNQRLTAAEEAATLAEQRERERMGIERGYDLEDDRRRRLEEMQQRTREEEQARYDELGSEPVQYTDVVTGRTHQAQFRDGEWIDVGNLLPFDFENKMSTSEYNDLLTRRLAAKGTVDAEYGDPDYKYTEAKTKDERQFEITDQPKQMMAILEAERNYDPAFAPNVPGTAGLENLVGATAGIPSTELVERQAEFWRTWKFHNELEQRHELFGSALTESEQREWRAATINPNMKPDQIQRHLTQRADLARRMAEFEVARLALKGRRPEDLQSYGGIVDVDDIISRSRDGSFWEELKRRKAEDRKKWGKKGAGSGGQMGRNRGREEAAPAGGPTIQDLDDEIARLEAELAGSG